MIRPDLVSQYEVSTTISGALAMTPKLAARLFQSTQGFTQAQLHHKVFGALIFRVPQ
jgi:hypothetical protein